MRQFIDKFEYIYEGLSQKKLYLIYALVGIVWAVVLVVSVSMPIFQSQSKLHEEKAQLQDQIKNLNLEQFEARKNSLNQQKLQKVSQLQEYREDFLSQMSRYQRENFVRFSNANMTNFLDLVMKTSLKHNLNIESVENNPIQNPLFRQSIKVSGKGSYGDIVSYLYGLLRYKAIVSLQEFTLSLNEEKNVEFVLLFSFGGE